MSVEIEKIIREMAIAFHRRSFRELTKDLQESVLRNQAMRNLIDRVPVPDVVVEKPHADHL